MLRFPFEEVRPGQDVLMRDLRGVLQSGGVLVCSAPTGIGKTAAALHPMLENALDQGRMVFFVTAKTSQQDLALATLRRMIEPDTGVCAVQIAARERVCPLDGRHCRPERCRYRDTFEERLAASLLVEDLARDGVVDAEQIALRALARSLCPFETSLALAQRSRAVVADLNYVFDPNVYLRRFFDAPYDRHLLVVDEAHNLPERAVEYWSPELELAALEQAIPPGADSERAILFAEVADHVRGRCAVLAEERSDAAPWVDELDRDFFERVGARAGELIPGYLGELGARPEGLAAERGSVVDIDPELSLLSTLRDLARCCELPRELFAALWAPDRLKLLCLDPGPLLRDRLRGFHATLCMSATLAPFEFHQQRLGLDDPDVLTLELDSPFPRSHRALLAVPSVDVTFRQRDANAAVIARQIAEAVRVRHGNYLAFFSSFAYRDQVVAALPPPAERGFRVLLQLPGMPAEPTLQLLRRSCAESQLLCAVLGGVFAEGVDYPGEMACGVFIVGPGLPVPTIERELLRAHYDATRGAGFEYAYLCPGLTRVVQAGGRAIRSADDRAFTVLFDARFVDERYRARLPRSWREELVEVAEPAGAVRAFWASPGVDRPEGPPCGRPRES
jgi:DNA excision repair protein ERCC-2